MSLAEFGVGFECHISSVYRHAAVNFAIRLLDSSEIIHHLSFGMRKIYLLCNLHFATCNLMLNLTIIYFVITKRQLLIPEY